MMYIIGDIDVPAIARSEQEFDPLKRAKAEVTVVNTTPVRVAACIPTYRRPANLAALLNSLLKLDLDGCDLHIIVVDNDASQSSKPIVMDILGKGHIPFIFDSAGDRDLPVARNRLVKQALSIGATWIWFLDDDQFVEPDTLRNMLAAGNQYQADCVVPRVRYEIEGSTASWGHWSGIFDELRRPTGKPAKRFGTNGPLFRATSVATFDRPFDPTLTFVGGHHGGEDSHFFARFHARGFRSIGCDSAVIYDRVHATRNNPQWLTHRALRIGLVKGFLVREVEPSVVKSTRLLIAGMVYGIVNALAALAMLPFGPSHFYRSWIRAVQGYGVIVGVLSGRRFLRGREQALVHGE